MNEVLKAIETRRSVRKLLPDMPQKEAIETVVKAGLQAASGKNEQAAMVIAVTNKELRDKISRDNAAIGGWKEGFDPFYGAPVILIVLGRKDFPTYIYDGSLMLGNMMLAAHSLGLANIWIHRAKEEFESEDYKALLKELGVEGAWEGIGHLALGYVDGDEPVAHPIKDNRAFYME